jgi:hypothetical protein
VYPRLSGQAADLGWDYREFKTGWRMSHEEWSRFFDSNMRKPWPRHLHGGTVPTVQRPGSGVTETVIPSKGGCGVMVMMMTMRRRRRRRMMMMMMMVMVMMMMMMMTTVVMMKNWS